MADALTDAVPATLVIGDSLRLRFAFPGYLPEDGWSLEFVLLGPVQTSLGVVTDGAGWIVKLEADSDDLVPGRYAWSVRVANSDLPGGAERITMRTGTILVTANPDVVEAPSEQRSFARRALDAIEAAILNLGAVTSFSVDGRSYQYTSHTELLAYRSRLRAEVADEDEAGALARGEPSSRTAWVRF